MNASVITDFDEFIDTNPIKRDRKAWQIEGKISVIRKAFVEGFLWAGKAYYIVQYDGLKILHEWSVASVITNSGFRKVKIEKGRNGMAHIQPTDEFFKTTTGSRKWLAENNITVTTAF